MRSLRSLLASALVLLAILGSATAPAEKPIRGTADVNGTPTLVELRLGDTAGELRLRPADRSEGWSRLPLTYPSDVLPLLADTRLQFLWAPLDAWAGEDLTRMRDRTVAATRAAWEAGRASAKPSSAIEGTTRRRVRALIQYAEALGQAGRLHEARVLLEAHRARMPLKSDWERVEWDTISQLIASVQSSMGDRDGAIATLAQAAERLADTPYRLNAQISQASQLAESGHYAQALELVDSTRAAFVAKQNIGHPVPGALLQFDWVRACALHGLGRTGEAAALMQGIAAAEQPTHKRLVPPANTDLLQLGYACARDADALAAFWARDLAALPIASSTLVAAQPAFRSPALHPPTLDRAHALFKVAAPMRVLPARYAPALRHWQ